VSDIPTNSPGIEAFIPGIFMNSAPSVHSVQFYDSHEALIDRLCGVVSSGLLVGDSVLIVATEQHREQLIAALHELKVDALYFAQENRFIMCDAEELLAEFMADGLPDSELFHLSIRKLLEESRPGSGGDDRGLVVFGEMVSVLWDEGNRVGALALEHLWNEVLKEQAFHLHCAYPRTLFAGDEAGLFNICESHSQVLGVPAQSDVVN
jgi:hypothetical protein